MAISNPSGNYIDKITLPTGTEYTIVDTAARLAIDNMSAFTAFIGVTTTDITDGTTSAVVTIGTLSVTAAVGSIVIKTTGSTTAGRIAQEYIYTGETTGWQLFGDISANNLGSLAYKSSASTKYTPAGSVNTTTGTLTSTGKFQPAGTIGITTATLTSTGKFLPSGTIGITTATLTSKGNFQPSGGVSFTTATKTFQITTTSTKPTGNATANFWFHTPAGSVTSTTSRTLSTATVVSSVAGNTVVSNMSTSVPSVTAPSGGINYTNVDNHNLKLQYLVKSTSNALSSTGTKVVVTGVSVSNTSAFVGKEIYVLHPTGVVPTGASFSGTTAAVTVTGAVISGVSFTGTTATVTVTGAAISGVSFTGTTATVTVTGTVINGASFSGTTATITVS